MTDDCGTPNGNVLKSRVDTLESNNKTLWKKHDDVESRLRGIEMNMVEQQTIVKSNTDLTHKLVETQQNQTSIIGDLKVKIYGTGAVVAAILIVFQIIVKMY